MILQKQVPNVVEIRDGWKLYIVAGGVMVRRIMTDSLMMALVPKHVGERRVSIH
jgi:hypothetical protein